jgi:hypothetical protein
MFWIIFALAGLAYSFIKIGALSVLVKVLTLAFVAAIALLGLTGLTLLVRRLFKRKQP